MLDIRNLYLQRGNKSLFEDASLAVYPNQKIGLVGKNGCGKSSLFALICGDLLPDEGEISLPETWEIATVRQETPSSPLSAIDYVLSADTQLQTTKQALIDAQKTSDGIAIANAHLALEEIGAYDAVARVGKLLSGLGFSTEEQTRPVKTFSGGWRMRLNLAQALIQRSDLLLLDEPTNHLDLETVLWLENYLNSINTTLLIISHDRDFLNATTKQTVELSNKKLTIYGGNYDFYQQERAIRLSHQAAAYAKQQAQIKHLQSFIDRFRAKATKARQAQSRIKALEKLEKISPSHIDDGFSFEFKTPDFLPDFPIRLIEADIGYEQNHPIVSKIELSLEAGGRYGLLGVNGSGKSTLIKTLVGTLPPISGRLHHDNKLKIGYFAQHQLDGLREDWTPIQHIRHISPETREQEIRNFLGQFAFSNNMATSPIAPFSGGEKARLSLALLVWSRPNLLLLDEPTNHLDLDMRYALTIALQSFDGALLLVSHDRSLLETVCDNFIVIKDGHLVVFDGNLEEYRNLHLKTKDSQNPQISQSHHKRDKRKEAEIRQEISRKIKPLQKIIQECETIIEALQQEKKRAETFLSSENAYNDENKTTLRETIEKLQQINQKIDQAEERWLQSQEEIEQIRQTIK